MEPKAIASSLSTIERQYKDMLNNKIMREREKNKQKNSKIKRICYLCIGPCVVVKFQITTPAKDKSHQQQLGKPSASLTIMFKFPDSNPAGKQKCEVRRYGTQKDILFSRIQPSGMSMRWPSLATTTRFYQQLLSDQPA